MFTNIQPDATMINCNYEISHNQQFTYVFSIKKHFQRVDCFMKNKYPVSNLVKRSMLPIAYDPTKNFFCGINMILHYLRQGPGFGELRHICHIHVCTMCTVIQIVSTYT